MIHPDEYDPTFLNARREARVIFATWVVALCWAVPWCWYRGFGPEGPLETVFGIPRWVFEGIILPWIIADIFALWFCARVMQDDDLGESEDETETAG